MLIGYYNLANFVTLFGLGLALMAGYLSTVNQWGWVMICLIHAAVADGLDGTIARRLKLSDGHREFGSQLDSMVDMAAYGIVPLIIGFNYGLTSPIDWLIFFTYASAAAIRLSFYNCHGSLSADNKRKFLGLPSTYSSIIFPGVFAVATFFEESRALALVRISYVVIAFLFVVRIKITDIRHYKSSIALYVFYNAFWLWESIAK